MKSLIAFAKRSGLLLLCGTFIGLTAYLVLRETNQSTVDTLLSTDGKSGTGSVCLCFVPYEISIGDASEVSSACATKAVDLALTMVQNAAFPLATFRVERHFDYLLIYKGFVPLAYSTPKQAPSVFDYSTTALTCKKV